MKKTRILIFISLTEVFISLINIIAFQKKHSFNAIFFQYKIIENIVSDKHVVFIQNKIIDKNDRAQNEKKIEIKIEVDLLKI